jgi:alkylation response protein AidB-like acyl-CoA dehydrogenase
VSIAITEDHNALAEVARSFLADRGALDAAHECLNGTPGGFPSYWSELCAMGWPGLHLPEAYGGQGYGLLEAAIVLEELGRVVGPGPLLPAIIASATIEAMATDEQKEALLPALVNGEEVAVVALGEDVEVRDAALHGVARGVLGAMEASSFLVAVGDDLVVVRADASDATALEGLDPTRSIADVSFGGATVSNGDVIVGGALVARTIARILGAAEAAGGTRACTEMAVGYAKEREQFGRTIGSFQAVKHHCAEMLVEAELAGASSWEATALSAESPDGQLAAAVAATRAFAGFKFCAEKNIQIHGGIGYTWEHPAHLYLRRAASLAALFGGAGAAVEVFEAAASGTSLSHGIEMPPEADQFRAEAAAFRERYESLPKRDRHEAFVESGYFMPHWPEPFGRGAGPIEQLVIDEVLGDIDAPNLGIGTWVLLTLVQSCTPDQIERWIRPGLMGDDRWCQLFSEPDAGSDAAAIKTKATRVDGGWLVNGQKVWTSGAHECTLGLATVRTDPDAAKHAGVSAFVVDLKAEGVEIRPLTEITGESLFNEVLLDDLLVTHDDVVGEVNQGWAVARATLGNQRVSIGGNKGGLDLLNAEELPELVALHAPDDGAAKQAAGSVIAEHHAMQSLNLRMVMRAMVGGPPGPEGAVTKLLSAEHAQRVAAVAMDVLGPVGVAGGGGKATHTYLFSRCLSIAGGTSEIVRNIIAERILGLPRDPLSR